VYNAYRCAGVPVRTYPAPTPGGSMLEVNDFNAIRISLASPEQIRSWSYGR